MDGMQNKENKNYQNAHQNGTQFKNNLYLCSRNNETEALW